MKVWAIKLGEGVYLEYSKNGFNMLSCRGSTVHATEDKRKAKHYKTEKIAGAVLKGRATEWRNQADRYEKQINQKQWGQDTDWIEKKVAIYRESADKIDTFEVVAVLVDTPNFSKQAIQDVKFANYGIGFVTKKSQGNLYCRGCGIYFKEIPIMQFGTKEKPSRICPWCIQERAHEAQKLLDDMNKDQRENAEAERFIHKMG